MAAILGVNIEHLEHATIRITLSDEKVLYFDPFKIPQNFHDAAMVFISHEHCGDTDYIPEMDHFKDIDIARMAVGGTYGMTAEEAAKAVNSFKPKVAIPIHYGVIVGTPEDGKRFKELVQHSR